MANEQEERLRDAFAQLLLAQGTAGAEKLLAGGTAEAVPMDAVWAAQGRNQFPAPPLDTSMTTPPVFSEADAAVIPLQRQHPQGYGGADVRTPMRQFRVGAEPELAFPTAGMPKPGEGEAPFGGKGLVVGPYGLPKTQDGRKLNKYGLPDLPEPKKKSKKGKG